ncbi:MAG: hypothetical protein JG768_637 [Fusobacteriales bacterium]|jgi:transcription elongation factor Elf1|nr:hypothetical protein [Fusobacteriales bacterium]
MKKILGEDIECPYCHKVFWKGDEVEVIPKNGKYFIHCTGCGAILEIEIKNDDKVYV